MGLPELYRIYDKSAQPAPKREIERLLYEKSSLSHQIQSNEFAEENHRETSNGKLGGKRADRIRGGVDKESRNVINKRAFSAKTDVSHPGPRVIFINSPSTETSTTDESKQRNPKSRLPKGGRSPQCQGKRR